MHSFCHVFPSYDRPGDVGDVFKRNCAQFYVDVVDEFCFATQTDGQENDEVIKRVIGYTFSDGQQQTKQFSPIGDDTDKSPIIRSFILQQLMRR